MIGFVELTSRFPDEPLIAVDVESIAAVQPYPYDKTLTEITLKAGSRAVLVQESVSEVIAAATRLATPLPRRRPQS